MDRPEDVLSLTRLYNDSLERINRLEQELADAEKEHVELGKRCFQLSL
jgi:hypothetical protein